MKQIRIILFAALMMVSFAATPANAQARRLTQDEVLKFATSKPQPEYPAVARQLRITGTVEVEISIDTTGNIDGIKVLTGNVALTGNLAATLKRWHFDPIQVDGKPSRAVAVLSFTFRL